MFESKSEMLKVSKTNQKPAAFWSLKGYEMFCWQSLSLFTQASCEFGSLVPYVMDRGTIGMHFLFRRVCISGSSL